MSSTGRRITILGAGAVGSALGGFLARAGHSVTLVGRSITPGSHLERICATGLVTEGILGEFRTTPAVADRLPEGADAPDLIILTVKSFDTLQAAEQIRAAGATCPVLHLQNGIGNYEILRDVLTPGRVLTGMIIIGFVVPVPGRVRVTVYGGDIKIGRMSPGGPPGDLEAVRALFQGTPLPVTVVPDIQSQLWAKLLYNCALNPLGAILGVPYGRLLSSETQAIIRDLLAEAFAVAEAEGVPLFWADSEQYRAYLVGTQIPATADHFPSMSADLKKGRKTEINFLNGAVTALARARGIAVPVNATLTAQIRFLEKAAREFSS